MAKRSRDGDKAEADAEGTKRPRSSSRVSSKAAEKKAAAAAAAAAAAVAAAAAPTGPTDPWFSLDKVVRHKAQYRTEVYVQMTCPTTSKLSEDQVPLELRKVLRDVDEKNAYQDKKLSIAGFPVCLAGELLEVQLTCYMGRAIKRLHYAWAVALRAEDFQAVVPINDVGTVNGCFRTLGGMGPRTGGPSREKWLPVYKPATLKIERTEPIMPPK